MNGIEVTGLKELNSSLNRVEKGLAKEMAHIHKAIAEPIAVDARGRVNTRSGRLAGSIRAQGTQSVARVAAGRMKVPYAGPNHFGWPGRFEGNPFLTDALEAGREKAVAQYTRMTDDFIARVWVKYSG